jgi:hypothetical protein
MIARDSSLRNLPSDMDRKQVLFLDGIRHAAEIADLAYKRLVDCLTSMADRESAESEIQVAAAFSDAWTVIDAVDRFRSLITLAPGLKPDDKLADASQDSLDLLLPHVRDLRNVADHIAVRIPQVLAARMPALGLISWFTLDLDQLGGRSCTLAPGALIGKTTSPLVNPLGKELYARTCQIHLAAGEHRVCISEVHRGLEQRVRKLETSLKQVSSGVETSGSDLLVVAHLKFEPLPGKSC